MGSRNADRLHGFRLTGCSSVAEIPQGRFRTGARTPTPVPAQFGQIDATGEVTPPPGVMDAPVTGAVSGSSDRSAGEK